MEQDPTLYSYEQALSGIVGMGLGYNKEKFDQAISELGGFPEQGISDIGYDKIKDRVIELYQAEINLERVDRRDLSSLVTSSENKTKELAPFKIGVVIEDRRIPKIERPDWKQWIPVYGVYQVFHDIMRGRPTVADNTYSLTFFLSMLPQSAAIFSIAGLIGSLIK